jgi:hypothetical protein
MSSFGGGVQPIGTVGVQGETGEDVRLGTPTDADLADGLVVLDANGSVVDAIDQINEAAKAVDDKTGADQTVGIPTDGDYLDGLAGIVASDTVADAVDKLNVAAKAVDDKQGSAIEIGTPTDGNLVDGLVPLTPSTSVVDAIDAINEAGLALQGDIAAFADRIGWVRIVTVNVPGGAAGEQVYDDPPGNTILQSVTVSDASIEVVVESSYPQIRLNGNPHILPLVGALYRGTLPITLAGDGDVAAQLIDSDGNAGAEDTVAVVISPPPAITEAVFVFGYPGSQTELKEDDIFQIRVTADKSFDRVVVVDDSVHAGKAAQIDVTPGTVATVNLTAADRGTSPQALGARVQVRDSVTGALSAIYDSESAGSVDGVNVVTLNNLFPTVTWGSPAYPGAQQALKGAESATVPITLSDLDTVLFDDDGTGELNVTNPTTIETPKTVTRAGGTYNISTDNLRATANRAANDATTIDTRVINIANVGATITVGTPAARLRSGGNDGTAAQNHSISISGDQELLLAPTMAPGAGSAGTFIGLGFVGGPSVWTRDLQVHDNDDKGVKNWQSLVATNLAGIVTSTISVGGTYELGGFVSRTVTWNAFQTTSVNVGAEIATFSKIQAGLWSATNNQSIRQPLATPPPVTDGYTASAVGVNPHTVEWLDTAAASSNSGTAFLFGYEEIV